MPSIWSFTAFVKEKLTFQKLNTRFNGVKTILDTCYTTSDSASANTVSKLMIRDVNGDCAVRDITARTLIGNVTGNITGNVTGNVVGNVTGNVTGSAGTVTGFDKDLWNYDWTGRVYNILAHSGEFASSVTNSATVTYTPESGLIELLTSASSASSSAKITKQLNRAEIGSNGVGSYDLNRIIRFKFIVQLSHTTSVVLCMGLANASKYSGFTVDYNPSNGVQFKLYKNGGVTTLNASSFTMDTNLHTYEIVWDKTNAKFYVDGSLQATSSTGEPAVTDVANYLYFSIANQTTAARYVDILGGKVILGGD